MKKEKSGFRYTQHVVFICLQWLPTYFSEPESFFFQCSQIFLPCRHGIFTSETNRDENNFSLNSLSVFWSDPKCEEILGLFFLYFPVPKVNYRKKKTWFRRALVFKWKSTGELCKSPLYLKFQVQSEFPERLVSLQYFLFCSFWKMIYMTFSNLREQRRLNCWYRSCLKYFFSLPK